MTIHTRFERLAAAAIDFDLTSLERADVADHLASCAACRTFAAGYRADATSLRSIAFAEPPAHIRSAVLSAAAHPRGRTPRPWRLLAVAALLLATIVAAAVAIGAFKPGPRLVVTVPIGSPSPNLVPTPRASQVGPSIEASVGPAAIHGDLLFFRGATQDGARNGSAWVVAADGGQAVGLGPAMEASWAVDGGSIHVMSQNAKCVPTLTTVSPDGQVRDVVRTGLRGDDAAFAWSPDGRQVAFIRWHNGIPPGSCGSQGGLIAAEDAIQDVVVMSADGSGQRVLVPRVFVSRPLTWSPDGTQIAFTNNIPDPNDLLDPVVVRVADGKQTSVARTHLDGVSVPRWSPDGTELAFVTYANAVKHIGVITVDGGAMRDLGAGDDNAQEPAWSPDGTSIAVAFDVAAPGGALNPGGIAIHAADGTSRRELRLADIQTISEPPAWSPDGAWLAYSRAATDGSGAGGIGIVALDGATQHDLPDTTGALWVAWQPAP